MREMTTSCSAEVKYDRIKYWLFVRPASATDHHRRWSFDVPRPPARQARVRADRVDRPRRTDAGLTRGSGRRWRVWWGCQHADSAGWRRCSRAARSPSGSTDQRRRNNAGTAHTGVLTTTHTALHIHTVTPISEVQSVTCHMGSHSYLPPDTGDQRPRNNAGTAHTGVLTTTHTALHIHTICTALHVNPSQNYRASHAIWDHLLSGTGERASP